MGLEMKIVQIAGYLGSGKTTLIIALGKKLAGNGVKVAILVNDVGTVPVDGAVMQEYGMTVKDIGGGCICCQVVGSMMTTLDNLAKSVRPDIVIIEPTGIAVPDSIRQTVQMASRKSPMEVGHTIVLFDTSRAEMLMTYDTLKRLVATQVRDATIVALSKSDLVAAGEIECSVEAVRAINKAAEILPISTVSGAGVSLLAERIRGSVVAA
jgi:G3E family GTPase